MWFKEQVLTPRIWKIFAASLLIQEIIINVILFLLKVVSQSPFSGIFDWLHCIVHFKVLFFKLLVHGTLLLFGYLHFHSVTVEKHISSTRLEKLTYAFSAHCLQRILAFIFLGALASFSSVFLLQSCVRKKEQSLLSILVVHSSFECSFVILHGLFTGFMFSLKYFICSLNHLKISLQQETNVHKLVDHIIFLTKDSLFCVLKAIHWFYLLFILISPFLDFSFFSVNEGLNGSYLSILYNLLNLQMFLSAVLTGVITFTNWSIFIMIFNMYLCKRYSFTIDVPLKCDETKCLPSALTNPESDLHKYLAVLDLRLLSSESVSKRRMEVFAISQPGGHPHVWNKISGFCISVLKDFLMKLQEYSVSSCRDPPQINKMPVTNGVDKNTKDQFQSSLYEKWLLQEWTLATYFCAELPNTKIQKIFSSSQIVIWLIETLGYLVSASYHEDKFGVVQQKLPEILQLLLDMKMAEEKFPVDFVSFRPLLRDDRFGHTSQRLLLRTTLNSALSRVAETFKADINGISLPEVYKRYLLRYLNRKNV